VLALRLLHNKERVSRKNAEMLLRCSHIFESRGDRVRKYFKVPYFWRLKDWIVRPLSKNKISGSGFFIGIKQRKACQMGPDLIIDTEYR
jgi:hypothetical protein